MNKLVGLGLAIAAMAIGYAGVNSLASTPCEQEACQPSGDSEDAELEEALGQSEEDHKVRSGTGRLK